MEMLNNLNYQSTFISPNCIIGKSALHWVRWISGDYANFKRNNESCLHSAEKNSCAMPHYITVLDYFGIIKM